MSRDLPVEGYLHGSIAVVSGRVAHVLLHMISGGQRPPRGYDTEVDNTLAALQILASEYRTRAATSAIIARDHVSADQAAPVPAFRRRLNTKQIAAELHVSEPHARWLCRTGRLVAQLVDGRWSADELDLALYVAAARAAS